ncbi:unnamed protein product [Cutaneotrichosporon oleaginosum]
MMLMSPADNSMMRTNPRQPPFPMGTPSGQLESMTRQPPANSLPATAPSQRPLELQEPQMAPTFWRPNRKDFFTLMPSPPQMQHARVPPIAQEGLFRMPNSMGHPVPVSRGSQEQPAPAEHAPPRPPPVRAPQRASATHEPKGQPMSAHHAPRGQPMSNVQVVQSQRPPVVPGSQHRRMGDQSRLQAHAPPQPQSRRTQPQAMYKEPAIPGPPAIHPSQAIHGWQAARQPPPHAMHEWHATNQPHIKPPSPALHPPQVPCPPHALRLPHALHPSQVPHRPQDLHFPHAVHPGQDFYPPHVVNPPRGFPPPQVIHPSHPSHATHPSLPPAHAVHHYHADHHYQPVLYPYTTGDAVSVNWSETLDRGQGLSQRDVMRWRQEVYNVGGGQAFVDGSSEADSMLQTPETQDMSIQRPISQDQETQGHNVLTQHRFGNPPSATLKRQNSKSATPEGPALTVYQQPMKKEARPTATHESNTFTSGTHQSHPPLHVQQKPQASPVSTKSKNQNQRKVKVEHEEKWKGKGKAKQKTDLPPGTNLSQDSSAPGRTQRPPTPATHTTQVGLVPMRRIEQPKPIKYEESFIDTGMW